MPDLAAIINILFATYNYFLELARDGQLLETVLKANHYK